MAWQIRDLARRDDMHARTGWSRLIDRWRALEDSPLGDVIGAVSIGVILILFLICTA